MQLRYYQQDAVNALYKYLYERDDNPCIVIPTGGGKTPVIATIARDVVLRWHGRVLILAHVKELLEQAADKIRILAPELALRTGVYSAGLKSRDTDTSVVIAGIQSVYKRACELGAFDIVIIDEAHLIPPDGEGMYRKFLADLQIINPQVRLVGLTATPYRMSTGSVCEPDNLLNAICYEVGVKELIAGGYLSPLVSKAAKAEVSTGGLHLRGGEYIQQEVEALMNSGDIVTRAVNEIWQQTRDRRSCLVFCAGVRHAGSVMEKIREFEPSCEVIFGDTLPAFREQHLADFKAGKLRYLLNVNVLTTGFDAPNVDCVILLRPTQSPGLYYQMVGRGFRTAPGKQECLVLDFGGNVQRHGPIDMIEPRERRKKGDGQGEAPTRKCPECLTVMLACFSRCPSCGYVFPPPVPHDDYASTEGVLSGQITYEELDVRNIWYSVHTKRGADPDAPKTMRIDYSIDMRRLESEWVCPEHTGYARDKFEKWWLRRAAPGTPLPRTARQAVELANDGALAKPARVKIKHVAGENFSSIVGVEITEPSVWQPEPGWNDDAEVPDKPIPDDIWDPDDEIPF